MSLACLLLVTVVAGDVLEVDDDGGKDYTTIGDAVQDAQAGDVIYVYNGTYPENIEVSKRLTIVGESMLDVVIDAQQSDSGIVLASGSDGSVLRNLTVWNATSDANRANVAVISCEDVLLDNLTLNSSAGDGLLFYQALDSLVRYCNISGNRGDGVEISTNCANITFDTITFIANTGSGLRAASSGDVYVNASMFANYTSYGVYASQTDIWIHNTSLNSSGNGTTDLYTSGGRIYGINLTYDNLVLSANGEGHIFIQNFLHILVQKAGSPLEGADIHIEDDNRTVYTSEGYSGTDPRTGPDGMVRWIVLTYAHADQHALTYNWTEVEVKYRSWNESRIVSMNRSHTEVFNYTGGKVLYVDNDNAGDPQMNGSADHPFDTISKALRNASDWDEIRVAAGTYAENPEINITVFIVGAGSSTQITNDHLVNLTADDIVLRDLFVDATGSGLNISGSDVTLDGISVDSPATAVICTGDGLLVNSSDLGGNVSLDLSDCNDTSIRYSDLSADWIAIRVSNCSDLLVRDTTLGFDLHGIRAVDASMTILNSTLSTETPANGSAGVHLRDSILEATNTSLGSGADADVVLRGSDVLLLNCTFNGSTVSINATSTLTIANFLHVFVNRTNGAPVEEADVNVTVDGTRIYATSHYGGTDPATGADGMVRWIVVENHAYEGSDTPTYRDVTVGCHFAPSEETAWWENRTVDMNTSHTETFTYVPPPVNRKPWTRITAPTGQTSEDVTIGFVLGDREGDTCDVLVQYSTDGSNYQNATLSGGGSVLSDLASSPNGTNHTLTWDSYADIPDVDLDGVWIRLIASDNDTGYTNYSGRFHVDNDLNPPSVDIDPIDDERWGQVNVYFNLSDAESARCHIVVEYLHNGTYHAATEGAGGNTSGSMITDPDGWAYVFQWRSADDLPGLDGDVTVRIIPSDGDGDDDNGTAAEVTFHLDNNEPPRVSIDQPSGEKSGEVAIDFDLIDPESDNCTIEVYYRLSDETSFSPADVNISSSTPLRTSPTGVSHTVLWNSSEIGEIEDTNIEILIVPSDLDPGTNDSEFFHVDNDEEPPYIESVTLPDDLYGDMNVVFVLVDNQSAPTDVTIRYRVAGGSLRDVDEFSSPFASGNPMRDLFTSPSGWQYNFTWHTLDEFGRDLVEDVELVFVATDGPQVFDQGPEYTVGPFTISNYLYIPRVSNIMTFGYRENITITYTLMDLDSDQVDVNVQYSTDNGSTWSSCAMASGGDGKADLETSPDGVAHTFVWDSYADLPDQRAEIIIRIRASDPRDTGEWNTSAVLSLNNILNLVPEISDLQALDDHGDIRVSFRVRDGDDDTVDVVLSYRFTSTFEPATVIGNLSGLAAAGPDWHVYQVVWDSIADIGLNDHVGLELRLKVTDGRAVNSTMITIDLRNGQLPTIVIRGVRTSAEGDDVFRGQAHVDIRLKDPQEDDCDVEMEYSPDGGVTWLPATLDTASGASPDGMAASLTGNDYTLVWNTTLDLGYGQYYDLMVRLRADDGVYTGQWAESDAIDVDNGEEPNEPPIVSVLPVGTVMVGEDIMIRVVVEDEDEVDVTLYYRPKEETTWHEVDMVEEENWTFVATIPASEIGDSTQVAYYVEADDGINDVVSAGTAEVPRWVTIERGEEEPGGSEEKADVIPIIVGVLAAGIGGAVVFIFLMKRKGGGTAPSGQAPAVVPPQTQQTGFQRPPGPAPPAQQPPDHTMGAPGATTSVCPVCGAPVVVPPQRPVTVVCNRCKNTFHVK